MKNQDDSEITPKAVNYVVFEGEFLSLLILSATIFTPLNIS